MDIHQFFSTVGDKVGKLFVPNQVFENILDLKTAIILISISLLISSLALLILALSHHRFKKARESLGHLFNEADYPIDVRRKFRFEWRFITMDVPGKSEYSPLNCMRGKRKNSRR